MTIRLIVATCTLVLFIGLACAKEHLSGSFGESSAQAFQAQVVNPDAGADAGGEQGLDSREASIIADSYHKSLAGKGSASEGGDQILVVEPSQPGRAQLPPPSVPDDKK